MLEFLSKIAWKKIIGDIRATRKLDYVLVMDNLPHDTTYLRAISGLTLISLLLVSCTGVSTPAATDPAEMTGSSPVSPDSADSTTTDIYKMHSESVQRLAKSSRVIGEVESIGSIELPIGEVPTGFDSVGFMVSCEDSSSWDIVLSSGVRIGASDCGADAGGIASVSILQKELNAIEVHLELCENVKAWTTIFATNEP